jgi:hypothetical protein
MKVDARIPIGEGEGPFAALVSSGETAPVGAVAIETVDAGPAHPAACACCAGRSPVAVALDRLFQARVRGTVPWFVRVMVSDGAWADVTEAVRGDAVTAARFRLAAAPSAGSA